jgi:hypothetical protein
MNTRLTVAVSLLFDRYHRIEHAEFYSEVFIKTDSLLKLVSDLIIRIHQE